MKKLLILFLIIFMCMFASGKNTFAQSMSDYCSIPPYIVAGVTPNLLLMIDNSASMNDLQYIDETVDSTYCFDDTYNNSKICSETAATNCTVDADCPGGPDDTCINQYAGYFDQGKIYSWDPGSTRFVEIVSLSSGCFHQTSYLCVEDISDGFSGTFEASGKFLNWLAASKIDNLKKILTGGKYVDKVCSTSTTISCAADSDCPDAETCSVDVTNYLEAESRGCVGKRFAKQAPADFTSGGDITFGVRGTVDGDANNPLDVSQGGNTIIDMFEGRFDPTGCQFAIEELQKDSPNLGQLSQYIQDCLDLDGPGNFERRSHGAFNQAIQVCWTKAKTGDWPPGNYSQSVENQCGGVYGYKDPGDIQPTEPAYVCTDRRKTCVGSDPIIVCNENSDCTGIGPEVCDSSGKPGFLGQCWIDNGNAWTLDHSCEEAQLQAFCGELEVQEVIDPTESPSETGDFLNIPAFLIDSGLVSQLGEPIGGLNVKKHETTAPTGLIHDWQDKIRFGIMRFNYCGSASEATSQPNIVSTCGVCSITKSQICGEDADCPAGETCLADKDGGKIISYIGDTDTVDKVNWINATTWTPFVEAFYNAIGYYVKDAELNPDLDPAEYTASAGAIKTPINDPDDFLPESGSIFVNPIQFKCQSNNILLISDGASTADINATVTAKATSPGFKDSDAVDTGSCGNFSGSSYMDDLSYFARNKNIFDLSDWTIGDDDPAQRITTYVVYSGPETSTETEECDPKTLMENTAANGNTTLYNAQNPQALNDGLDAAFGTIAARAASGTAASVLSTSVRGAGSVVQAYFLPVKLEAGAREVSWIGYLQNIWLDTDSNLREDTVHDYKLKLDDDDVLKLYFDESDLEVKGAMFTTDVDGEGGTLETCEPTTKDFDALDVLWRAGGKLANKAPSTRDIFTSKKVIRGTTTTHTFTDTEKMFTVSNVTGNPTLSAALNPDVTYTDENIVRYIRGECLETGVTGDTACGSTLDTNFRDRRVDVGGSLKVWKLGDVVSSTPKVFANAPVNTYIVDYGDITYRNYVSTDGTPPDANYKTKSAIAFAGANDGTIHAFNVGYLKDENEDDPPDGTGELPTDVEAIFKDSVSSLDTAVPTTLGEELWSYIPFNAFPYLKYLAHPDYCHIYYVDLSVRLIDASTNGIATDTKDIDSWETFLIGGMRFGGACGTSGSPADPPTGTPADIGFSSYFAIDITDPENPDPLWEFSDEDMGYATTYPSIIRTGAAGENGNWYVVLGSGSKQLPESMVDIARSTPGYLYVLNLKTGELVKKVLLDHNAIVGDVLAIDADKDYHSEKIYFGTSYDNGGTWSGKLMKIDIPDEALTDAWSPTPTTLFSGVYPFTASPEAAMDHLGRLWVYEGSGKFYSALDGLDTSQQIFIGLKDIPSITYPVAEVDLFDATNVLTEGTVTGTKQACVYDLDAGTFGLEDVVTTVSPTSDPVGVPTFGWKIDLQTRERVISRALAIGGLLDFVSYVPSTDICEFGGETLLYSVSYTKGVAPINVSIRSPEATSASSGDVTVRKHVRLGPGAPPTGDVIIVPPVPMKGEGGEKQPKKIQVGTGAIAEIENEPAISIKSKIMHWLRK